MVSRRSFVLRLLALCGLSQVPLIGCQTPSDSPLPLRRVRLGSVREFTAQSKILFLERVLVRRDERGISAMSMTCTHQSCMVQMQDSASAGGQLLVGSSIGHSSNQATSNSKLANSETVNAETRGEFVCPCHGSRFDPSGKVIKGPAQRDLTWLPLEIDGAQQVWATFGASVTSDWRLPVPGPT